MVDFMVVGGNHYLRDFRQHITIDGRQTVEVDYSTLALRMVYAT